MLTEQDQIDLIQYENLALCRATSDYSPLFLEMLRALTLNEADKAALAGHYKDCSVYVALERADMREDVDTFRQILKGGGYVREAILRLHIKKSTSVFGQWNLFHMLREFDYKDEVEAQRAEDESRLA